MHISVYRQKDTRAVWLCVQLQMQVIIVQQLQLCD